MKADFTPDDIRKAFDTFLDTVADAQYELMCKLGEECLVEARERQGYMTQTGALQSSTGFAVFVDGQAVHSRFDAASGAQSGAAQTGMDTGRSLAEAIGKDTSGIALVVVAGMNYALYVEARGRNVLTSSRNLAERELPRMLSDLTGQIEKAVRQ